ncbi:putative transcription factor C2C2-YABBY family [Helianthus annuus]|uniref:Putative YABBY protein n=1 Tax=Helianthus annuus TaxID=4232 RepID=A0A251UMT5_HELAN|nr:putative transcription factor C2C2-YABBY family [Helianthus annuus]KAJ0569729.1 putative transcription factor C2C2-YABBY family [Helianthus annuus]KAJ0584047.1 putative transcription factor C2C2-YABBY family [Helianthus annuus]KAJ0749714.1 putative transcription factor C2C2-YABBY family [Helianthus annuus]KAJ0918323.1 putative transcription factor C2C2-YABBY family [Helianthus annuus]
MANTSNFCNNEVAVSDEQLCYIPCNFCNIVLAVSVPCSKLFDIVKVKCEYCNNMWPVNMGMVAGFHHPHPNHTSQDSSSRLDDQVFFFTFITLI